MLKTLDLDGIVKYIQSDACERIFVMVRSLLLHMCTIRFVSVMETDRLIRLEQVGFCD